MKQVFSFFAMFALVMSMASVNAQDKPKEATQKAKTECGSEAKKGGCCSAGATKTRKMAAKHECSDKCDDGCTMAAKVNTSTEEKKN
jgi:hypothetical protein